MDKLKMHSPDLTQQNIDRIAELFPGVVTERLDEAGNPVQAVDFDMLRQELSDHVVEGPQERYQLDWPGKRDALFASNAPIAKTLRPVREESVDFDTTQNLFIEGDNLDALKLLQESYLGKVKLIYIDPPYNTGKDFIYSDDFAETADDYLVRSRQHDPDGISLVANTEANGRFHSSWLTMMYSRLRLARNLLSEDGVLMASINDVEAPRLRQLLDEVFGERNFLGQLVWMKGREGGNDNAGFGQHHEYVIAYARSFKAAAAGIALDEKDTSRHRESLPEPNRVVPGEAIYREGEKFQLINLSKQKDYEVVIPLIDGSSITWPSYAPQSTIDEYVRVGRLFVGSNGVPYVKSFLADEAAGTKPSSLLASEWGTTKAGGIAIRELFGSGKLFSYPKPPKLIQRLIQIAGADRDSLILDFFAGSSATAHAVLAANAADGGRRRFLMVQIDEPCAEGSEAKSAGYQTISQLSMERIRRAAQAIAEGESKRMPGDLGFRCLRVDSTNMAAVRRTPDELAQSGLEFDVHNVKPERTGEDLLFQVLLDWGLDLNMGIATDTVEGQEILVVDDGALIACFGDAVTPELVRAIARRQPLRAVFQDSSFATDADRINAEQIFAEVSPATDVKVI